MSGLVPGRAMGDPGRLPDAAQLERDLTREERRSRWAVRAAQWRARELAEIVFGGVTRSSLIGMRLGGAARGLLQLDVPFEDLDTHRAREARFLAAAGADPVLSQVPLVYVIGPAAG
jgi:hypothetical protein